MAFSESFQFGNSTFMNIESLVKHAISDEKAVEEFRVQDKPVLEVIQESPTKSKNVTYLSRTHRSAITNRSARFRRSKSETTLQSPKFVKEKTENYTEFFQSDFICSLKGNGKSKTEDSMVNLSAIEAALDKENEPMAREMAREGSFEESLSRNMDKPICSEDIKYLLDGVENSENCQTSLCLSSSKIIEDDEEKRDTNALDSTAFLDPMPNEVAKKYIDEMLATSKKEMQAESLEENSLQNLTATAIHDASINQSKRLISKLKLQTNKKNIFATSNPMDTTRQPLSNLDELKSITAWNLPTSVLAEYKKKGVINMFDWQVACLSNPKVLFEHKNLVYSAPTSAGKTLVSEILLLKTVLERGKKALLILPFISVVREKMFYLQDLLTPAGYRAEGFFGGYTPPGGFDSIHVAICTIEKANSIVNKLLEQGKLSDIGTIVVDEVHLISDPGRGYILELLLAKIMYMSNKYGLQIQIITMSATLSNVQLLQRWLQAELYITDFRPVALQEMFKVGTKIYDRELRLLRDISMTCSVPNLDNDADHVAQLCIETILQGCSVLVFCPSKDWCENLAIQLAAAIHALGKSDNLWATRLREHIKRTAIDEVKRQLRDIPTGLDSVLNKTISYACAFHHAGLTTEERDIVEASFKSGALKIIVATSTLSSGVNLPARRVLIRTPLFGGKQMSSLTYRQMIGRAGRTGKDTLGESILICTESNARIGRDLISADMQPISSCLDLDSSTHLKRAILEVVSAGVASTPAEIECFVNCTLLSAQKLQQDISEINSEEEREMETKNNPKFLQDALDFLIEYEFVRLQHNEETAEENYVATRLGNACLASSMPPTDGLLLFAELQKARRCFVLESDLHAVYLVTPYSVCYQLNDLNWLFYLDLWEKLTPAMRKVGELVGVKESFLVRAMRGQSNLDYKLLQVHKRFYTALALQELINETPINVVANKYKCPRGMLQSLQQMSSTFAGIVAAFCNSLQWCTLALIVSQFKERLYFGIHRDLIDLMRLPDMSHKRARSLFDAGIGSLVDLAQADVLDIEKILFNALSFDSAKQHEHENAHEAEKRNMERIFFITGKSGLTVAEGAKFLVYEARQFVKHELGVENIMWTQCAENDKMNMSIEENKVSAKIENKPKKITKLKHNKKEENKCAANKLSLEEKIREKIRKEEESVEKVKEEAKTNILKKSQLRPTSTNKVLAAKRKSHEIEIPSKISPKRENIRTDEKPSTSLEALKIIRLQKVAALKKKVELKSTSSECVEPKSYAVEKKTRKSMENHKMKSIYNKENFEGIVKKEIEEKIFIKPTCTKTPATTTILRRSPRQHLTSSTLIKNNRRNMEAPEKLNKNPAFADDLFEGEESIKIDSAVVKALDHVLKEDDEIPSSQNIDIDNFTSNVKNSPRTQHQASRLMRSLRRATPRQLQGRQKIIINQEEKPQHQQTAGENEMCSSSLEFSDISLENSLIKQPLLLNASHVLSCSKQQLESALSFKSIDIVDICGNEQLFKSTFKELLSIKRMGFCLGLQKHEFKRRPLIGAKLLLNQQSMSEPEDTQQLQHDDDTFVSGLAFSVKDNIIYYMNMQDMHGCSQLNLSTKCKYLLMLFSSNEHTLLICDAKEQLKILHKVLKDFKLEIKCSIEDPKVANWLLQPDKMLSYPQMTQQFAPECSGLVKLCGSGRGYISYGLDADSAIFSKVRCSIEACVNVHILKGQIENLERIGNGELYKFFQDLEMPLQMSLCHMELCGFPANEASLSLLYKKMIDTCKQLEAKVFELHGSRFNFGSSAAVAKVLGLHKKSNGRVSTSRQILEKIDSPIAQLIIYHRKISSTLSNNVQPLMKCIKKDRIHGQSITYTATGRISMTEPNLQNVAKDFLVDLSKEQKISISCRDAFYSKNKENCLLSADFCQLEMRILAHLSQDPTLLKVMNTEEDLFTAIAARWNHMAEHEVSSVLRNGTKQICYGIVYGMGMRSLSEALKCTEDEAHLLSEQFHATYPGIRTYAEKVVRFARNNGYIETITGRRRYLQNINSMELNIKNQAERQAINSTIQGSAADIAKSAILRMEKNILKYSQKLALSKNGVRLVLHLHDELIFEVPLEKSRKVAKVLSLTMENCVKLSVPLRVKLKIGPTWAQLKDVKL